MERSEFEEDCFAFISVMPRVLSLNCSRMGYPRVVHCGLMNNASVGLWFN